MWDVRERKASRLTPRYWAQETGKIGAAAGEYAKGDQEFDLRVVLLGAFYETHCREVEKPKNVRV